MAIAHVGFLHSLPFEAAFAAESVAIGGKCITVTHSRCRTCTPSKPACAAAFFTSSECVFADTDADYELKRMLLDDMFNVVDVEGKLTGKEVQVGGFDLIWQGGPIKADRPPTCSTFLGVIAGVVVLMACF